jgi:hypothetical protein
VKIHLEAGENQHLVPEPRRCTAWGFDPPGGSRRRRPGSEASGPMEARGMTEDESENFIEGFRKDLLHVDDFVQAALNGHLQVESELDDIIDLMFLHPSYIEKANLSFYQKVYVARGSCELGHERPEWALMLALNSVRNKLAHRSIRKELGINISNFRNLLREMNSKYKIDDLNGHDLIVYAVATCCGYPLILRDRLRESRGLEPLDD